MEDYNDALLTLTGEATPDPFLIHAGSHYHLIFTAGDRIEIWSSESVIGFHENCDKTVVWRPPPNTNHSSDLWAPELHALSGRWYIYFAGASRALGNVSHRMYVLGGPPSTSSPTSGPWTFLGPITGIPESQWAIDGTLFPLGDSVYFVYSGWPLGEEVSDLVQQLFIVKLADATHVAPESAALGPVRICEPQAPWEFTVDGNGRHGINEGPQWLTSPRTAAGPPSGQEGQWAGLVYSCAGSWTCDYKMNTLQYLGGDPLRRESWRKGERPLCSSMGHGRGPYGPGHGSFLTLGGETVGIFHATDGRGDGWRWRKARVQRVAWVKEEDESRVSVCGVRPFMGECVGRPMGDLDAFTKGPRGREVVHGDGEGRQEGLRALLLSAKAKV